MDFDVHDEIQIISWSNQDQYCVVKKVDFAKLEHPKLSNIPYPAELLMQKLECVNRGRACLTVFCFRVESLVQTGSIARAELTCPTQPQTGQSSENNNIRKCLIFEGNCPKVRIIEHTVHTNTRRARADAHRHCPLRAEFEKWPLILTWLHNLSYSLW